MSLRLAGVCYSLLDQQPASDDVAKLVRSVQNPDANGIGSVTGVVCAHVPTDLASFPPLRSDLIPSVQVLSLLVLLSILYT